MDGFLGNETNEPQYSLVYEFSFDFCSTAIFLGGQYSLVLTAGLSAAERSWLVYSTVCQAWESQETSMILYHPEQVGMLTATRSSQ